MGISNLDFFPVYWAIIILCYLFLFDISHSNRCEVISHCGFDLHYLMISDVEHLFTYLLDNVCVLWKNDYSVI